jgi:hypothetical protein
MKKHSDSSISVGPNPYIRFGIIAVLILFGLLSANTEYSWMLAVAIAIAIMMALTRDNWKVSTQSRTLTHSIGTWPFPKKIIIEFDEIQSVSFESVPTPTQDDIKGASREDELYRRLLGKTWKGWVSISVTLNTGVPLVLMVKAPRNFAIVKTVATSLAEATGKPLYERVASSVKVV